MRITTLRVLLLLTVIYSIASCSKKDTNILPGDVPNRPNPPDSSHQPGDSLPGDSVIVANYLSFTSHGQEIADEINTATVALKLDKPAAKQITVTIELSNKSIEYGKDYTTVPAADQGKLKINIPAGTSTSSFIVNVPADKPFKEGDGIDFRITAVDTPIRIANDSVHALRFLEKQYLDSLAKMKINTGPYGVYKVFVDLSENKQLAVAPTKWDFGFYSGGDDFRVVLNSSAGMLVKRLDKNDLNAVTVKDTTDIAIAEELIFSDPPHYFGASASYFDDASGDLSKTAIAAISANAADNKVYIVNRGWNTGTTNGKRPWQKIRVLRNNSGGYTLQYADITATNYKTINIPKNDSYYFNYVSLTEGLTTIEPEKKQWDIALTWLPINEKTSGGEDAPYFRSNVFVQNRNVTEAQVSTKTRSFAAFTKADLTGLTFSSSQIAIGASWRLLWNDVYTVHQDIFYVVKDGNGRIYKLRVTNHGDQYSPEIEYAPVK
ncbi:HmuY family protein [Chitinophaga ginsengisoli]|nr:HmuY family protein [Chitinophaga ginsengisoli]